MLTATNGLFLTVQHSHHCIDHDHLKFKSCATQTSLYGIIVCSTSIIIVYGNHVIACRDHVLSVTIVTISPHITTFLLVVLQLDHILHAHNYIRANVV